MQFLRELITALPRDVPTEVLEDATALMDHFDAPRQAVEPLPKAPAKAKAKAKGAAKAKAPPPSPKAAAAKPAEAQKNRWKISYK